MRACVQVQLPQRQPPTEPAPEPVAAKQRDRKGSVAFYAT